MGIPEVHVDVYYSCVYVTELIKIELSFKHTNATSLLLIEITVIFPTIAIA